MVFPVAAGGSGRRRAGHLGTLAFGTPAEGVVCNPTHDFWVGFAANADLMAIVNCIGAGRFYGLDALVEKVQVVRATPQLRSVLG